MLLTDEEIKEAKVGYAAVLVNGKPLVWDSDRAVAKVQLKKVAEDLGHKCARTEGKSSFIEVYIQALLEEVKE